MEIDKNNKAINRILKGANKGLAAISPEYQFIDYDTLKITVKSKGLFVTFYITRNDLKNIKKTTEAVADRYKNNLNIKNDALEKAAFTIKLSKDYFKAIDSLMSEYNKTKTINKMKDDFVSYALSVFKSS
ncbi:MAG: hypothetical protein QW478_04915 [Candidatus Micrarchaeaceae archaeon]